MFESLLFRPNYPTSPKRSFDFYRFPNDLIADGRNYYTEIEFYSYDSGFKFPTFTSTATRDDRAPSAIPGVAANIFGETIPDVFNSANYSGGELAIGQGIQGPALGKIVLPLPQRINDTQTYSWGEGSALSVATSLLQNQAYMTRNQSTANFLFNLQNFGGLAAQGAGVVSGLAINPMMFQQFQRPNFREFQFQWTLAPRTRTESATIATMVTLLKRAASPDKYGLILTYPLIAMIKFSPNNLTGHPSSEVGGVVLKPCIIQAISVDYTPVGPSFFKGPEGAPVIVGLSLSVKELQLLYRGDYNVSESRSNQISQSVPLSSGIRDDRATPVTTERDDRAPRTSP